MTAKIDPIETTAEREFVISRVFAAPREALWQAWTEPQRLAQWCGPRTFTNFACEADLQLGGEYRIVMRSPEGVDYPLRGVYLQIVAPERLVMTVDCSKHPVAWHDLVNPDRNKSKKPTLDAIQTATFGKLDGKTKLTVRVCFESAAIRDALLRIGMEEGWSQSMDRLARSVSHGNV
jgi:uncharacterized protein YndB with AHSA1/START domain